MSEIKLETTSKGAVVEKVTKVEPTKKEKAAAKKAIEKAEVARIAAQALVCRTTERLISESLSMEETRRLIRAILTASRDHQLSDEFISSL